MRPSFLSRNALTDSTPSSSTSSSTSSSVKSFSPAKTMEEVWQDINLASLEDNSTSNKINSTNRPSFPCMILQDFLATPSRQDQSSAAAETSPANQAADDRMSSRPATMLSLNSACDCHYFARHNPQFNGHTFPSSGGGGLVTPFDVVIGSSPAIFKKRPQRNDEDNNTSCDRRHKRMIKNRESAARSRARKQAYAQELEMEVAQLREENARLRKEQEKLLTDQVKFSKKKKLCRTSTAPF